ncbi:DUF805 domain-containing protein [Marilutibacter aestuarii]|uniref:DUF805 domain-containing protein n=1 Tax=Marilutibacter aestuarii TaxID=1706195 RepID=A0A508AH10_9GAMM|nr:DUF805 domain-containing protein [Lysobacter aestuarii]
MNWYLHALKECTEPSGHSRRKEHWMFVLFNILFAIALAFVDGLLGFTTQSGGGYPGRVYSLAVLVTGIAAGVRRLHDTGRSGCWLLIGLIPLPGAIVLIVFFVLESEAGKKGLRTNPRQLA